MSHRTFSWSDSGTEILVFEVERVGNPGEEGCWSHYQTLATLQSHDLLEPCIEWLKQHGWGWVPAGSTLLRKAAQVREVPVITPTGVEHRQQIIQPLTVADLPSAADIDNWLDSEAIGDLYYWCQKMRQMLRDGQQDVSAVPLAATPAEAFSGERSEP